MVLPDYEVLPLKVGHGFYADVPVGTAICDRSPVFNTYREADEWGRLRRRLAILRKEGNRGASLAAWQDLERVHRGAIALIK